MVPLNKEQKETALKRITFIERELKDLEEYRDLEFTQYETDRKTRRNVERILENIMNASADIAKVLLAGEDVEMPATYREVIIKLGELQILKKEVASTLADFMRLRNILAHQYLDLKWELIKNFLQKGRGVIKTFLEEVRERGNL